MWPMIRMNFDESNDLKSNATEYIVYDNGFGLSFFFSNYFLLILQSFCLANFNNFSALVFRPLNCLRIKKES